MNKKQAAAEECLTDRLWEAIQDATDADMPSVDIAVIVLGTSVTMLRTISNTIETADLLEFVAEQVRSGDPVAGKSTDPTAGRRVSQIPCP